MRLIKVFKVLFIIAALITWAILLATWLLDDQQKRHLKERQAELIGSLADSYIARQQTQPRDTQAVKTVASLHQIEIAVEQLSDKIYRATGVANSYLIKTTAGNVLFDTGLGTQAAKQKRLLQEVAPEPVTHIILSHSHADHLGGTKYWRAQFPDAKIITHRQFLAGQGYLKSLERHFWNRNRLLYTFMPEQPPADDALFAYGGITPDILVDDNSEYRFTIGTSQFVLIPAPGAEGDDNLVLWLPDEQTLLSGDFFGPLFPMLPNLFTLRGERFRDPVAYLQSLQKIQDLGASTVLPSHFDPINGAEKIRHDVQLMHDATEYMYNATIAGMNAGKSVWQLMDEIQLPEHLEVSQGHGKLSWNVRSIWQYYSTWFKFESTTELYPVPVRTLYAELAQLAGGASPLTNLATQKYREGQLEQSLHLIEMAVASDAHYSPALQLRLDTLNALLLRAQQSTNNFSETGWLQARIAQTQEALKNSTQHAQ